MHERDAVAEAAVTFAAAAPPGVTEVTLVIAPGVDPDIASEVWVASTAGTPIAHATLHITIHYPMMACLGCDQEYTGDKLAVCPQCGGDGLPTEVVRTAAVAGWVGDGPA